MRNKPKRECGSCQNWVRWKADKDGRGLCELLDLASPAQYGKNALTGRVKNTNGTSKNTRPHSLAEEHILGKDEVVSSILTAGFQLSELNTESS